MNNIFGDILSHPFYFNFKTFMDKQARKYFMSIRFSVPDLHFTV